MTEQKELNELKTGDEINHFLLLNKIELKTTRNNKEYLSLELRDKSMVIPAKMWDDFNSLANSAKEGSIVKIKGTLEEFNNQPQIRITKIRLSQDSDNVSHEDFLPKSSRPLNDMVTELKNRIEVIQNEHLKSLLNQILAGDTFEKYISVPAGKSWHHSYLHGLLEHTLEIVKICDLMCSIHSELNRDLLITGALLHDFGKTEELSYETGFDYTDEGRLLGHIVIAALKIDEAIDNINDFPKDLKTQLIHLILSHQGKLEYASPVEPKTLEAIVLYHADELSAKTNAYKLAIHSEQNKEGNWTKFLQLAGTALYTKRNNNSNNEIKNTLFD
ncbi:3'-5' exoribonuclease YhaM [bacterium BMS3Abin04]|nr:3'-5' exoribonuclease YhaM [bacterium BMS3Abin04]